MILLSDQFLADSTKDIDRIDLKDFEVERPHLTDDDLSENKNAYKRYKLTEDGISPLTYPGGLSGKTVFVDSHEHNELGRVTEDEDLRNKMVAKRKNKMQKLKRDDLLEPEYIGDDKIDYLVLGWGSTFGPIQEAQYLLKKEDIKVGHLAFNDIWPLPVDKLKKWKEKNDLELIVVENNSTAQLAKLIGSETQISIDHKILKYSGRPYSGTEIYQRIKDEVINSV